ncbi:MAG: PLP-dependent aminotransferase family protein [Actinomycetes bacterium]
MSWATATELDQILLPRWRSELRGADGALRDHLAAGIFTAVCHGELPVGSRLPAERRLADELGISRGTVVAALDQLVERGILERRAGSGSYVRSAPITAVAPSTPRDQTLVDFWMNHQTPIDLAISSPIAAPAALLDAWPGTASDAVNALLGPLTEHGYSAYGIPAMRQIAAEQLTAQGFPSTGEDVIVTCGAQQALQLSIRALVKPGDRVFVDSPTYPGFLAILRQSGAVPVPLRCDAEGVLPADLIRAVREHGSAILATSTLVSNPNAAVLSRQRREALVAAIVEHDVVVIEDLTLADTLLDDVDQAAPLTADPRIRGVAVGSASKVIWGGLRVGWLRTHETWLRRIAQAKALEDFGTSAVTQRLAVELLTSLTQNRSWRDHRRTQLRERRDLLIDLVHEHLPSWGVHPPPGGLSLWIRLPGGDGSEFATEADRAGVHVMPGEQCGTDGAYSDYLRLCFDREPEVLHEAVTRLAQAHTEMARAPIRLTTTVGP